MSSFDSVMKTEKLAAIALVIIIAGVLSTYLLITYGDEILDNLTGSTETIKIGDCVDVHYTGSFENGTIFDTSYADIANQSGIYDETRPYEPLNIFVSLNATEPPPEGYETYFSGMIEGFMEGLIGLKEGETATIGPIPPEKAYGVYPKIGDEINIVDPSTGEELTISFVNIQENAPMPEDYVEMLGTGNTTLFLLKYDIYSIGDEIVLYPSWENATVITKLNETLMWYYITPPEDQRENFTWIDSETGIYYWENASSVTSMNNSTIVVTHTPKINATMDVQIDLYSTITYTVLNVTDTKINVSYDDGAGNISYYEFDRTVTIERNETQNITMAYPLEGLDQMLQLIKMYYDPELTLSVHELAGESLLFDVEIVNVYKTSQEES
jgi:FKBP-type peptidyl-prolyl cis-trans isomerase 2